MKKLLLSMLTASLIIGIATAAMAQQDKEVDTFNFEEMKPFMEKMHPNFSTDELKKMFESCHGENGMMKNMNSNHMHDLHDSHMKDHL